MRRIMPIILLLIMKIPATGGILINEISAGGSSDWIELKASEDVQAQDISSFFVTMYYGTNEKISAAPVTLRGKDIPGTPYDDRFAVIHFTQGAEADETDATGDTNRNGVLDLYCKNYGLWNTDCVVAIDIDDEPKNDGIRDFTAFSNRDGSPNSTINGYMKSAADAGEWITCTSPLPQDCMVFIGAEGLKSYSTLSRKLSSDTNSPDDFTVTPYSTPGRENIIDPPGNSSRIAAPLTEKIMFDENRSAGVIPIPLFLYKQCSIRVRIFNSAGMKLYSSDAIADAPPGYYTLNIKESQLRGKKLTGLYPVVIEFLAGGRSEVSTIFLVIIKR